MDSEQKKKIILVLPEAPQSLRDSGISIRYIPLIESIFRDCTLDALVITREKSTEESLDLLRKYCRRVNVITHPDPATVPWYEKLITRARFLMPLSLPRSWVTYGAGIIKNAVKEITVDEQYSTVICVSGYNYPYIHEICSESIIVDFIDSPSVLAWRNVIGSNRSFISQKYEFIKTILWEAKIIKHSRATLYISTSDIKAVPAFMAPTNKRHVIRNGYCADDYTGETRPDIKHPAVGFLGNMSYYPNIEAVLWLYHNVFIPLKASIPDINLYIIGRSPDKKILELSQSPGVVVTGEVKSIWSYLNSMDVLAFPILRGAGVKNKLLEAMYANKPVLTSKIGNEGIDATSENALIVCNHSNDYINVIRQYITNEEGRNHLTAKGREFVEMNFSWVNIQKRFRDIVLCES